MAVKLGLLSQGEEYMFKVFENGVLRRVLVPKRDEVADHSGLTKCLRSLKH
jgi:hypothetical protein